MKKGFTLIELLVALALIGILTAIGIYTFSGFIAASKEKACFQNFENLKKKINANWGLCKLKDNQGGINIPLQFLNNTPGADRELSCGHSFETIAGETAKSFGNYASSPYDKNLSYNIPILSYIGDPPMDGGIAYYPESAGFMLRVRCSGKIKRYQWPK